MGQAHGVAVDSSGNVYVAGFSSDNVFQITPGGTITEIIDATGDGAGNLLEAAYDVAVDSSGNVFVSGIFSDNAFKLTAKPPQAVPSLNSVGIALVCSLLGLAGWRIASR